MDIFTYNSPLQCYLDMIFVKKRKSNTAFEGILPVTSCDMICKLGQIRINLVNMCSYIKLHIHKITHSMSNV